MLTILPEILLPSIIWLVCWVALRFLMDVEYGAMATFPFLINSLAFTIVCFTDQSLGCSSPAAYGNSISYVSANIVWQGYVFLMVLSVIIIRVFWERIAHVRFLSYEEYYHLWSSYVVRFGIVMVVLTGVFPLKATNCKIASSHCWAPNTYMNWLHLFGIGAGILVSGFAIHVRIRELWSLFFQRLSGGTCERAGKMSKGLLISLGLLGVVSVTALIFGCIFITAAPSNEAAKMHICVNYEDEASCLGQTLPRAWKELSDAQGPWPCSWDNFAPIDQSACTNVHCDEDVRRNRRAIIFEHNTVSYWVLLLSGALLAIERFELDMRSGGSDGETDRQTELMGAC